MVYFKLMMEKCPLMMVNCYSMMAKWVNGHILNSPSLTSISPSLTSILPSLAWSKPSFAHLTIIWSCNNCMGDPHSLSKTMPSFFIDHTKRSARGLYLGFGQRIFLKPKKTWQSNIPTWAENLKGYIWGKRHFKLLVSTILLASPS